MGVQLTTSAGPITVTWTDRFFPYGVEVLPGPIERYVVLHDQGPERVGPDGATAWSALVGSPIRATGTWWEHLELGPTINASTGRVIAPKRAVELPVAIRLDFAAGSVWFVAAIPDLPSTVNAFIPGDEIMVVFTSDMMRSMGFADPTFVP